MRDNSLATAITSVASIETAQAARYLGQLCAHFSHKLPVTHEGQAGLIAFDAGNCRMNAANGLLLLTLEAADNDGIARLQDVIGRHLLRFAFREDLRIEWRTQAAQPALAPP